MNPVDFIALESLRVFLPALYDVVRTNPDRFSGHSWDDGDRKATQAFHEQWINEIPVAFRASIRALLESIFPKISQAVYGPDWLAEWRRNLRACHPNVFPIYFRFTVPQGAIRRSEMKALLSLAASPSDFGNALVQAREERRPDGISKARALLERLMDYVKEDIPDAQISSVIQALFNVGDALIDSRDERGMFDLGGQASYTSRLVYHLLKRLTVDQRVEVLEGAIDSGSAVAVQMWLLQQLDEAITKTKESSEAALLGADEVERLKAAWLGRVRMMSSDANFLHHPELSRLLTTWKHWGDGIEVRAWCNLVTTPDEGLLNLLPKFLQHTRSQTIGDWAVHLQPRLNPSWLEEMCIDTAATAARLQRLQRDDKVPDGAQEAVSQYLTEFEMLQAGKDPDDIGAFDDHVE